VLKVSKALPKISHWFSVVGRLLFSATRSHGHLHISAGDAEFLHIEKRRYFIR